MLLSDRHTAFEGVQAEARARFEAMGFPGRGHESWHYTQLDRLLFETRPAESVDENVVSLPTPNTFDALAPSRLVFVDGVLDATQSFELSSQLSASSANILVEPIANPKQLKHSAEADEDGMLSANLAHLRDAVEITVSGAQETPLEIIWLGSADDIAAYGRVVLNLKAGASLTLIEHHAGKGMAHIVNQINLAKDASLTHVKFHNASISQAGLVRSDIAMAENAKVQTVALCLNAGLARHESVLNFNEAGAFADMASVVIANGAQHMDMTTRLNHNVANTNSETIARSVLDDKARVVFQGKVLVRKDAQHVKATQKTNALMLSRGAEMNAKPELEIYADDVACAHGSAIGEIDRDAMFFLRSRGLKENEARDLLIGGFVAEVIDRIADETLRNILKTQLEQRLSDLSNMTEGKG